MTNNRFLYALRQYRDHARRKNVSYAAQVHQLVDMRQVAIDEDFPDGPEKELQLRRVEEIALAEYGKFDAQFTFAS